jgi:hypothetical protein
MRYRRGWTRPDYRSEDFFVKRVIPSTSALVLALSAPIWAAFGCGGIVKSGPVDRHADGGEGGADSAGVGMFVDGPTGGNGTSGAGSAGTHADGGAIASRGAASSGGMVGSGNGGGAGGRGAAGASGSGGAAGVGGSNTGPIGDPTGVTAIQVADFLDSLGVCTHIAQGVDAPSQSATAMAYAGIRNLRDDGDPAAVQGWISMHQSAGIRVVVLSNKGIPTTIDMAKQLHAAGALLAVEGPNEPNNFPVTYEGQTSSSTTTFVPVAHFQRDLYAAVKADVSLSGIPVFHSSEAGGSEPDNVGLQFLTIPNGLNIAMPAGTKYADYANTHNYVCGHKSILVDNMAWNASDPTLNGDWDGLYVEYGHTWKSGFAGYSNAELVKLPRVTTETGWVTSGTNAINQEQQGRLFMNLYLAAFKQGIAYTFIYMLRDDPVQGYWGLFDTAYQPKKSGTYVHNLTTIMADTGSRTPGKLNYAIDTKPTTVHDLLLQKSDGTFALVVWDERPSGGSDAVMVNLGSSRASVKVYDPTIGTAPSQTLHDVSSVMLTLSDHPMVLEL